MRVLFLGDVSGRPGRKAVQLWLDEHKGEYDICIVNGENAAAGFGITEKIVKNFVAHGVDAITMGNHTWDRREIFDFIDAYPILRPANYPRGTPGRGFIRIAVKGVSITVVNLMGRIYMECLDNPFVTFDSIYSRFPEDLFIVDFHGEATSEKQAFGYFVDGRACAVLGTHTHVQTADLRLLPGGTLYITDAGMCGALDSVIGMDVKESVERFTKQLPVRFKVPDKPLKIQVCGVSFAVDVEKREVVSFERIRKIYIRGEDGNYY
ncbi:TIGR00282 family metallophosphoesterase [Desulfurobacterium sp.]